MRESFFSQNKHKSNKNRIASSYLDPLHGEKYSTDMCSRIELKLIRGWRVEEGRWSKIGKTWRKWSSACYFSFYLACHFLINPLVGLLYSYERQSKRFLNCNLAETRHNEFPSYRLELEIGIVARLHATLRRFKL